MAKVYQRLNHNALLKEGDIRQETLTSGDVFLTEYGEFFLLLKRDADYDKHASLLRCPRRNLLVWHGELGYFSLFREVK